MSTLTIAPPDQGWLRRLRQKGFTIRTVFDQGQHEDLKRLLLSHAGVAVVLPVVEHDKNKILTRGQIYQPRGAIMHRGEHNRCHQNAFYLWDENRDKLRIATGYAMCARGVWRQHSWCVWPAANKPTIVVETTVKAKLYFGAELTADESIQFGDDNAF